VSVAPSRDANDAARRELPGDVPCPDAARRELAEILKSQCRTTKSTMSQHYRANF
jgi:hypothetical protein